MGELMEDVAAALMRYAHLIGSSFNVEWVRRVENAQRKIMEAVAEDVKNHDDLEELLAHLLQSGRLYDLASMLARELGEEIASGKDSIEAALSGNSEAPGFRAGFLTIQAVARAFAEEAESVESSDASCPICGSRSETMWKREGDYYMVCHFCGYTWLQSRKRPSCPYCGNKVEISLFIVTDKQRRVALLKCEECKSTWRAVIDETIRAPPILVPLIAMAAEKFRPVVKQVSGSFERYSTEG